MWELLGVCSNRNALRSFLHCNKRQDKHDSLPWRPPCMREIKPWMYNGIRARMGMEVLASHWEDCVPYLSGEGHTQKCTKSTCSNNGYNPTIYK
eukprot:gene31615-523_t